MSARFLDQSLFSQLSLAAGQAERQRQHHNLHAMEEPCHRLLVGLQPDTYIAPHRHLSADKAETLLVLQGRVGVLLFNDDGSLQTTRELSAAGECRGVDLAPGQFHALVVLDADSILFECKAGPYCPLTEAEWGNWAPREGDPQAAGYREWMRAQFRA